MFQYRQHILQNSLGTTAYIVYSILKIASNYFGIWTFYNQHETVQSHNIRFNSPEYHEEDLDEGIELFGTETSYSETYSTD